MGRLPCIVRRKTLLNIGGHTYIGLVGRFQAADEVDVFHETPRMFYLWLLIYVKQEKVGRVKLCGGLFGYLLDLIAGGARRICPP